MSHDPQALALNKTIEGANQHVYAMLSTRGQGIFFPKLGILAQSAEAAGKKINATIGTALEEDGSPMCLPDLLSQFSSGNKLFFNYAPSPGRPDTRATWKQMMLAKNPQLGTKQISMPVVTNALTHGLSMAGYLFVNEGDEIIVPDLYWENYDLIFKNTYGAQFRTFQTFENNGFNTKGLKAALTASTSAKKIVMINFPNNPTGYTATISEAQEIINILVAEASAGTNLVVLLDDAYFGLVFESGVATESLFGTLADAHPRILAIKLDGPTKEDYVWGFRVGFMTFGCGSSSPELYAALEAKCGGAVRGTISNASNPAQMMLAKAYTNPNYQTQRAEKFAILKSRYEKVKAIFAAHPEYAKVFNPLPFNSGYFMCVKTHGIDGEILRKRMLAAYDTGVIAQGNVIRLAFSATPLHLLEMLFDNMYKAGLDCMGEQRA